MAICKKNLPLTPTFRSGEAMKKDKKGFSPANTGGIANSAQRSACYITHGYNRGL